MGATRLRHQDHSLWHAASPCVARTSLSMTTYSTAVGFQVTCATLRYERGGCSARAARNPRNPAPIRTDGGDRWGGSAVVWRGGTGVGGPGEAHKEHATLGLAQGFGDNPRSFKWTTAQLTWNPTLSAQDTRSFSRTSVLSYKRVRMAGPVSIRWTGLPCAPAPQETARLSRVSGWGRDRLVVVGVGASG